MIYSLTRTILKLLEKPENQDLVNNAQYKFTVTFDNDTLEFVFDITHWCFFRDLPEFYQREVIRVCLECLPFFERENPELRKINLYSDPDLQARFLWLPPTLKAKYQARLFLPIAELDEEFLGENILEKDLN